MKRLIPAIALAAAVATPAFADLRQGTKAPDFTTQAYTAGRASTFTLSEALKSGPVVLYFYPAAYTAGCNIEAHAFSEAADQFTAQKTTLVGITAGNVDRLEEYSKDTEYCAGKFPMLADPGAKIAKMYDAARTIDASRRPAGSSLPSTISTRTSYMIDPNGDVVHAFTGRPQEHVSETLGAVKAWRAKN